MEFLYNIIDISEAGLSVVNITPEKTNLDNDVSGIKIDLSRNITDLSDVNNPYTFSQHDKVYVWWDSKAAYEESEGDGGHAEGVTLLDRSGNFIWDASAQGFTSGGRHPDISGLIDGSSSRKNYTGFATKPGALWSPPTFFGLEVLNNIEDIKGISGSIHGKIWYNREGNWSRKLMPSGDETAHIKLWTNEKTLYADNVEGVNDLSNQWDFEISGVKYDISRVQIKHDQGRDQSYIKLDISCMIYSQENYVMTGKRNYLHMEDTAAHIETVTDLPQNSARIWKTDICRNNYESNIRNISGNYLRHNGTLPFHLEWDLAFEATTKAEIDRVFVDENYPKRLYFDVLHWDHFSGKTDTSLKQTDLDNINISNFNINMNNKYAVNGEDDINVLLVQDPLENEWVPDTGPRPLHHWKCNETGGPWPHGGDYGAHGTVLKDTGTSNTASYSSPHDLILYGDDFQNTKVTKDGVRLYNPNFDEQGFLWFSPRGTYVKSDGTEGTDKENVHRAQSFNFGATNGFTFAIWVKFHSVGNTYEAELLRLGSGPSSNASNYIVIATDDLYGSGSGGTVLKGFKMWVKREGIETYKRFYLKNNKYVVNQWYHMVWTATKTDTAASPTSKWTLYINGLAAEMEDPNSYPNPSNNDLQSINPNIIYYSSNATALETWDMSKRLDGFCSIGGGYTVYSTDDAPAFDATRRDSNVEFKDIRIYDCDLSASHVLKLYEKGDTFKGGYSRFYIETDIPIQYPGAGDNIETFNYNQPNPHTYNVLDASSAITLENNVITPYYNNSNSSYIDPNSGDSIYMWFHSTLGVIDISNIDMQNMVNNFKIITRTQAHTWPRPMSALPDGRERIYALHRWGQWSWNNVGGDDNWRDTGRRNPGTATDTKGCKDLGTAPDEEKYELYAYGDRDGTEVRTNRGDGQAPYGHPNEPTWSNYDQPEVQLDNPSFRSNEYLFIMPFLIPRDGTYKDKDGNLVGEGDLHRWNWGASAGKGAFDLYDGTEDDDQEIIPFNPPHYCPAFKFAAKYGFTFAIWINFNKVMAEDSSLGGPNDTDGLGRGPLLTLGDNTHGNQIKCQTRGGDEESDEEDGGRLQKLGMTIKSNESGILWKDDLKTDNLDIIFGTYDNNDPARLSVDERQHHLVFTASAESEPGAKDSIWTIYVDGRRVCRQGGMISPNSTEISYGGHQCPNGNRAKIGSYGYGNNGAAGGSATGGPDIDGEIMEIAIYDHNLSENEIIFIYNQGFWHDSAGALGYTPDPYNNDYGTPPTINDANAKAGQGAYYTDTSIGPHWKSGHSDYNFSPPDISYNILDVSAITVVNIKQNVAGFGNPPRDVSGIKIDLSRNINADISNVTNPYTFSQYDNIWSWWDSKAAFISSNKNIERVLQDCSGNPIWDASAQGFTSGGLIPEVSGLINQSTRGTHGWGDMRGDKFYGLGVSAGSYDSGLFSSYNIVDIWGISAEIKGIVDEAPGEEWNNPYTMNEPAVEHEKLLHGTGNSPPYIKIYTNYGNLFLSPPNITDINDLSNQWHFDISYTTYNWHKFDNTDDSPPGNPIHSPPQARRHLWPTQEVTNPYYELIEGNTLGHFRPPIVNWRVDITNMSIGGPEGEQYIRLDLSNCIIYGDVSPPSWLGMNHEVVHLGGGSSSGNREGLGATNNMLHEHMEVSLKKTDICRNNYYSNIRNISGNYLRKGGINLTTTIKWNVVFDGGFDGSPPPG